MAAESMRTWLSCVWLIIFARLEFVDLSLAVMDICMFHVVFEDDVFLKVRVH
jgi:hypothetical protein